MGNCQPINVQSSSCSLDEEEFSVLATPNSLFSCHEMDFRRLATRTFSRQASASSINDRKSSIHNGSHDIRMSFLKLHRPDLSHRRIIESDEVNRILWVQADELLRRRGLMERLGAPRTDAMVPIPPSRKRDNDDYRGEDGEGSKFDVFSDAGGTSMVSGFTTASRSTIVAANVKPKTKKRLSKRHPGQAPGSLQSVKELDCDEENSIKDYVKDGAFALHQAPANFLGKLVSPKHATTEIDTLRSRYMSVLRLKMKARLGQFYTQRYLAMFPDVPRPYGVSSPNKKREIPGLALDSESESSESSGNSVSIDYGALPPTTSVKCSVTDESFLDLAITGSLGLVPRRGRTSRASSELSRSFVFQSNLKSPDHYIVLINRRSGIPLAVCAMKAGTGAPVVRIYATRQRVFLQRHATTTRQLGLDWANDLPLFTWAEVVTEGHFPDQMNFFMFMANGSDGRFSKEPSYTAQFDGDLHQPVIKMMGQTDMERASSGCALISIRADEDSTVQRSKDDACISFQIDLAQGIDPALLICFTAIADEVIEKSMRIRCKERVKRRIRKASYSLAQKRMAGVSW